MNNPELRSGLSDRDHQPAALQSTSGAKSVRVNAKRNIKREPQRERQSEPQREWALARDWCRNKTKRVAFQ